MIDGVPVVYPDCLLWTGLRLDFSGPEVDTGFDRWN